MIRRVLVVLVAGVLAGVLAIPAAADPPARFEVFFTPLFFDPDNGLVVFANIDRASYCTDEVVAFELAVIEWLAGGMVGDPPPEPASPPGFDPISVQRPDIRTGAVTSYGSADDLSIELWHADSPANQGGVGPCTDTDDDGGFFASGTTSWQFHASDLAQTGTRADQVSAKLKARVTDEGGNGYRYSFFTHDNLECRVRDGELSCFVENTRLIPAN